MDGHNSQAEMTLAEGLRAILATGVLRNDGTETEIGLLIGRRRCHMSGGAPEVGGGAGNDVQGTGGRAQALEYFNPHAGKWDVVRNECDW